MKACDEMISDGYDVAAPCHGPGDWRALGHFRAVGSVLERRVMQKLCRWIGDSGRSNQDCLFCWDRGGVKLWGLIGWSSMLCSTVMLCMKLSHFKGDAVVFILLRNQITVISQFSVTTLHLVWMRKYLPCNALDVSV